MSVRPTRAQTRQKNGVIYLWVVFEAAVIYKIDQKHCMKQREKDNGARGKIGWKDSQISCKTYVSIL